VKLREHARDDARGCFLIAALDQRDELSPRRIFEQLRVCRRLVEANCATALETEQRQRTAPLFAALLAEQLEYKGLARASDGGLR